MTNLQQEKPRQEPMHARIPQLALGGACKKPRTAKEEIEKKRQINNWKEKGGKKEKHDKRK
jgi:hypothetical protein